MKKEEKFQIIGLLKTTTDRGSNCFEITVVNKETGEQSMCTYFGNTTPKRVTSVEEYTTKDGSKTYLIAKIQPHTSRDKKTGKFISAYRT